jgi:hypothetical protein
MATIESIDEMVLQLNLYPSNVGTRNHANPEATVGCIGGNLEAEVRIGNLWRLAGMAIDFSAE